MLEQHDSSLHPTPPISRFSSFSDSKQPSCWQSPITASVLIPLLPLSSSSFFTPPPSHHQLLCLKAQGLL
ncbi:hypothetical protein AMECASPLE_002655 [Ameca splendens]|uniref:Uncharacterized protein n=1 Tax=Ameca splendens TaxID=208324 RepID=A0ABV0YKE8_9TELE